MPRSGSLAHGVMKACIDEAGHCGTGGLDAAAADVLTEQVHRDGLVTPVGEPGRELQLRVAAPFHAVEDQQGGFGIEEVVVNEDGVELRAVDVMPQGSVLDSHAADTSML